MQLYSKTPSETRQHTLSLADALHSRQIKSVAATVTALGLVTAATLLAVTPTATDMGATLKLEGGTDGEIYRVDASFTLEDDDLIERSVEVHVIELDFAVPEGGTPISYISPRAYMDRYGLEELLMLTGVKGADQRTVNKNRFFAALQDAAAEIDAMLSARFEVPVQNPPPVLVAHAATITREILHRYTDAMPEHIEKAAKATRRALHKLATSDLDLPGLKVRQESVGTPLYTSGEAQFTTRKLEGF